MVQEFLTGDEVARLLRVSRDTVYTLASRGELPGRRVGRTWRFPKDTIESYIREHGAVVAHDGKVARGHEANRVMDETATPDEVRT